MSTLLNQAAFRRHVIEQAKIMRNGRFSRYSPEFANRLEAKFKIMIREEIHRLPSVGKTIQ